MSLFRWLQVFDEGAADPATRRSTRGSVAVQVAILAVVLLGMVSLGVEITGVLLHHRQMQSAADAGAMAGAGALAAGNSGAVTDEARGVVAADGFVTGVDNAVVTVNNPPVDGAWAGDASAVQVVIEHPRELILLRLFRSGTVPMTVQAVALTQNAGRFCILALKSTASGALSISNNAILTNLDCGVAVNSSSASALIMSNNTEIRGPVLVHGGASLGNHALLSNPSVTLNGDATSDPYADVVQQTPPACTAQSGSGTGTKYLTPGHFCSGWNFGNNATINLAAGTYYVDSRLIFGNGVTINGMGGVTIIVNGTYAINTGNNAIINLTAPSSGTYAGLAIMGPRNSTSSVVQNFRNNLQLNVTGAIYFPSQTVTFSNNGRTVSTICTQVIAQIVRAQNNLEFDNNCDGTGVRPIGAVARLVQ